MPSTVSAEEAAKLLQDVPQEWQAFWFNHGAVAKNLRELSSSLEAMTDEQFEHHVNSLKNDLAEWLEAVVGDQQLAGKIRLLRTLAGTHAMVSRRVAELDACCLASEASSKEAAPAATTTVTLAAVVQAPTAASPAPAHVKTAKRSTKKPAAKKATPAKKEKAATAAKAAAKGSVWSKLLKR